MDFVVNLPTAKGFVSILVVVDRFSKMIHLVPLAESTSAEKVTRAFFTHVVKFHGLPSSIISDCDPRFMSTLWQTLFKRHMGTALDMSTAYHP